MKKMYIFLSMFILGNMSFATIQNLKTDITISVLRTQDYKITDVLPENGQTQWVAEIPNGVALNEDGILPEDGYILKDTELIQNAHGLKNKKRDLNQENPMYFKGKLAVITSSGSENWYHWLLKLYPDWSCYHILKSLTIVFILIIWNINGK